MELTICWVKRRVKDLRRAFSNDSKLLVRLVERWGVPRLEAIVMPGTEDRRKMMESKSLLM